MKFIKIILIAIIALLLFETKITHAQIDPYLKRDSLVNGDTVKSINPAGMYGRGAFTVKTGTGGDTLLVQVKVCNSPEVWATTSAIKNVLTQSNVTSGTIEPAANTTVSYEILEPVILGVRIIRTAATVVTGRITTIDWRFIRNKFW